MSKNIDEIISKYGGRVEETQSTPPTPRGSTGPPPSTGATRTWGGVERHLPAIGATVGGMAGGVPGAAFGGAAGDLARQAVENPPPTPYIGAAMLPASINPSDIAWAAVREGAFERVGRSIAPLLVAPFKFAGKMAGSIRDKGIRTAIREMGSPITSVTKIMGRPIPETLGQAYGAEGGLMRQLEGYLSGSYFGGPLRHTAQLQEETAREIMDTLSRNVIEDASQAVTRTGAAGRKTGSIAPLRGVIERNWSNAREVVRGQTQPLYAAIGQNPTTSDLVQSVQSVQSFLSENASRMTPRAKSAIQRIAGGGDAQLDEVAQSYGVKSYKELVERYGERAESMIPPDVLEAASTTTSTLDDVLSLRREIGTLASSSRDPVEKRIMTQAHAQLSTAIKKQLTPEQQSILAVADRQWRKSYIVDRVSQEMRRMERLQSVGTSDENVTKVLIPKTFTRLVNDLAHVRLTRDGVKALVKEADLDILFDNPADRKAMRELAEFLNEKYDAGGITEKLARIGLTMQATDIPLAPMTGRAGLVQTAAGAIAGLTGITHLLAKPGGAQALWHYFKTPATGPAAGGVAATGRLLNTMYGLPEENQ